MLGLGCIVTAGAIWLFSPDDGPAPHHARPVAVRTREPVAAPSAELAAAAPEPPATPPPEPTATTTPTPGPTAPATLMPIGVPPPAGEPSPAGQPSPAGEPSPHERSAALPGDGRPRLAIIIDDCGQWPATERGFVALPFPVTLSVLPHVRYGPAIAREADAAGKGVMLHLPMQTVSGRYPGPGTITTTMADAAIRDAVAGDLAELPQARGVNNHEGSLATADPRVMGDVIDVLEHDGDFFIDSRTSAASVAASVAHTHGVPSASRDVFLDNVDDVGAVEAQLREAAARARASGQAIAIGHPRPATLLAVRTLAPSLAAGGIDLTLASNLVR